jgi:hypothetical protein
VIGRHKQQRTLAGQSAQGMVECLVAFGVLLADSGIVTRDELARTFRLLVEQQRRNTAALGSQAEFEARIAVPWALAEFFAIPVSAGPQVIQGGKVDPE